MSARTKEQTRKLMLDTGKELLQEHGVPEEMPIKLSEVLARLKLTTGAAYHIWDSQDAFRRDLTLHVAQTMNPPLESVVGQLIAECQQADFVSTIRAAAARYLEMYVDADVYTRLYFWTIKEPSPAVAEAATAAYDKNGSFTALCREVIANFGRQITAAANADELAATTVALLDGFSLRARFDSARGDNSFDEFGSAVARYLDSITEPV